MPSGQPFDAKLRARNLLNWSDIAAARSARALYANAERTRVGNSPTATNCAAQQGGADEAPACRVELDLVAERHADQSPDGQAGRRSPRTGWTAAATTHRAHQAKKLYRDKVFLCTAQTVRAAARRKRKGVLRDPLK